MRACFERWIAVLGLLIFAGAVFAQEPPREPPPPAVQPPSPAPPPHAVPSAQARPPVRQALELLPPDAPRLAFVIGQGAYQAGPLATAVNDAGLVAEALRGAGFDVTAGADLDETRMRDMLRDFVDRVEQAPPDSAVFVYLAGRALQNEGENIFLPVGARLEREGDALLHGIRLGDLTHALADTPPLVKVLLVDSSGSMPPFRNGRNPPPGLAIMDPPENVVIGFSNAPDAIAPEPAPPYGAYAKALAEMMRQPGLGIDDMLAKTRLRVHEETRGQQTPWDAGNLRTRDFNFFVPQANTQAPPEPQSAARLQRGLQDFPPAEAYAIVVERDRIADYQDFLRVYPNDPLARRVKVLLAPRREALLWRKAVTRNSPEAYWTYLRTYPQGSFVVEARRRLARLQVEPVPPQNFSPLVYEDVPPPLAGIEIVEPAYTFGGYADLPPPPPPPVYILPPPEPEFVVIAPPPPRPAPYLLPVPVFVNRPGWARPPRPAAPPPPVRANAQQQTAPAPVAAPPQPAPQPATAPPAAPAAPAPQPLAPQQLAPKALAPQRPATRQELRQQLQQRQQQLQTQQGRPVTQQQRRELRQQLQQEQRALQTPNAARPNPVATPAPARPLAAPAPSSPPPDQRRLQMQQKEQQMMQQRQQQHMQDRQQQMQDRQQQMQQQRQQQIQQQRQQVQERQQQRQQQMQERQQQIQQRQQEIQQRQQQMQQQRQQQMQQRQQDIQQRQQQIREQRQKRPCGQPGQPACP